MSAAHAQVLRGAADLIANNGWCQRIPAFDSEGVAVNAMAPDAVCFCADAAIAHKAPTQQLYFLAREYLRNYVRDNVKPKFFRLANWNDDPKRTQEEVVSTMRECAAELEGA